MLRFLLSLLFGFITFTSYSWNGMGHLLVAQIAYDHLTLEAKQRCNALLAKSSSTHRPLCKPKLKIRSRLTAHGIYLSPYWSKCNNKKQKKPAPFVSVATWLDTIRFKNEHRFDALHYIDIPFSEDNTRLPELAEKNALQGLLDAMAVLQSEQSSKKDKALSLRILIHVMGDIHQPLHTITRVSRRHPEGDRGGNLFPLDAHEIAPNLHAYWDKGAGFLLGPKTALKIRKKASLLEAKWSCGEDVEHSLEDWIKSSHDLAIREAYTIKPGSRTSLEYKMNTQAITQKQVFFAGCRLAALLNHLEFKSW